MAQALIKINGVIGSNDDLPINTDVLLDNEDNGGESFYFWEILDQPPGPPDSISIPTIKDPQFRPKKEGSYLIQLTVNNNTDLTNRAVAAVRFIKTRERAPAAQEQTEVSTAKGWGDATNNWFAALDNFVADPGVVIGVAGEAISSGDILRIPDPDGFDVIMPGLPGQQILPKFRKASGDDFFSGSLFLFLSTNTGSSVAASGDIIKARLYGLFVTSLLFTPTLGEPVYINADGVFTDDFTTAAAPRSVGYVVSEVSLGTYAILYNGLMPSSAAIDLLSANAGSVGVSPLNAIRLINDSNVLKVSVNGGAYSPIGGGGGVYTAGNGLQLIADEFSVATSGIIETMIADTSVSQAKLNLIDPVSPLEAATKQYVDDLAAPFDVGFYFLGQPDVDDVVLRYTFCRSVEFPAGLTGSSGSVEVPSSSIDCEFSLFKVSSGISTLIGSVLFGPADTQPSFSFGSAVTFNSGDTLRVVGPLGSADSVFSSFSVTFKGVKV